MQRSAARRFASVIFGLALLTLLLSVWVALVYHGDQDLGAGWITGITFGNWIAGFSVLIAVCFVVLLILFLSPTAEAVEQGGAKDLMVNCANCGKDYLIQDPGTRPLYHQCPHCEHTNQLGGDKADVEETVATPEVIERMEGGELKRFLVLRCGACESNFEVPFTEERPIVTTCANCGRRGILN